MSNPKMQVEVGADISGVKKGMSDVKKELASAAIQAQKLDSSLKTGGAGANQATFALTNLGRVAQDLPFGFIGIQNNLNPLLESFQRLKLETGSTKGALSALGSSLLGAGGLGLALSVASTAILIFQNGIAGFNKKTQEAADATKKLVDGIDSIIKSVGQEAAQVTSLIAVLSSETETRNRKLSALQELKKIQPEIFNGLRLEKNAVIGLDDAYKAYVTSLRTVIAAKLTQQAIETKITELIKLQGVENTKQQQGQLDTLKKLISGNAQLSEIKKNLQDTKLGGGFLTDKQSAERISQLNDEIKGLFDNLKELSSGIKIPELKDLKLKSGKVELLIPELEFKVQNPEQEIPLSDTFLTPRVLVKPDIKFIDQSANQQAVFDGIAEMLDIPRIERLAEQFGLQVAEIITNVGVDLAAGIGNALGDALGGGKDVVPNLFGGLMTSVGSQVQELGKFLIKSGIQIKIAKEAFNKLLANPLASIAVGIGLVALGALLKAQASKQYKGFATGVRNYQGDGGIVTVGERGPENIFLPRGSTVQPNNEVNAYGRGGITLMPSLHYEGTGFRIMLNRVDAQLGRNN